DRRPRGDALQDPDRGRDRDEDRQSLHHLVIAGTHFAGPPFGRPRSAFVSIAVGSTERFGAPERSRTPNPQIRSRVPEETGAPPRITHLALQPPENPGFCEKYSSLA